MGPASGKAPRHQRTTPTATKAPMALLVGPGQLGTGGMFPARCETEEVYSAPCKQITRGALSHSEKMRNIQDAKICLQLKPRRFKSRHENPQTRGSSREPMLTDKGKSMKSLTALQEFAAAPRPSQIQIWALQSYSSSAHYPPNFALSDNQITQATTEVDID